MSGTYPTTPAPARLVMQSITPTLISATASLSRQARTRGAQRFAFQLEYPPGLTWSDIKQLFGFLSAQRGQADTFAFNLQQYYNTGTLAGSPVVNGAAQTGRSIDLVGFTPSAAGVLARGDFIQFTGDAKTYIVTEDASANISGEATAAIHPQVMASPGDGVAIIGHAKGDEIAITCAAAVDVLSFDLARAQRVGFSIELAEVV